MSLVVEVPFDWVIGVECVGHGWGGLLHILCPAVA